MAISPMFKVSILAHSSVTDALIGALQRSGVIQIAFTQYDLPPIEVSVDDARVRAIEEELADATFVRDLLGRHHTAEHAFKVFVAEKFHIDYDDFLKLDFDTRARRLYRTAVDLADEHAHGERELARLRHLVAELQPWSPLHRQISEWRCTPHTVLMTGTVASSEGPTLRQRLRDATPLVTVEEVAGDWIRQAWLVIAHESEAAEVRQTLATGGFVDVTFEGLSDYPAEELSRAQEQISRLEQRQEEISNKLSELSAEHYHHMVTLVQALESERDRLMVRADFGSTQYSVSVCGWVPQTRADELRASLQPFERDVDLTLAEPTAEDDPPVQLDNPAWLRPLEVLTDLYGRPRYGDLDPTPLLAPFFLAFFGICIGDVGYGAMLMVGAWLIKTRIDVAPGVKRFMDLLIMGGLAGIVFGVAFASYFAIPLEQLPPALLALQVLDPLNELPAFLLFTVALGVLQVFFGVFVAAYKAFKRGEPQEAIFGQLSIIFLFAMVAAFALTGIGPLLSFGLIGTMLMQGGALQRALGSADRPIGDRAIGWLWLAAVLVATAMMGLGQVLLGLGLLFGASIVGAVVSKTARDAFVGLLGGVYAVYGMTSFVGDTLSYTRLAALGLSASLVGYVFNVLTGLVWGPVTSLFSAGGLSIVWGVLLALAAAALFVFGHVFNVVINLLGAFVHPARLQFVEFFSKFYEAGGRGYEPFKVRSENLVLEAGGAGPEGGAG